MNKAAIIYIVLIIIILLAVTYYYMSVGSSASSSASTTPSSGSTYVAPSSGSTYVAPSSGSTYVAPSSTSFVSTNTPSTSSTRYINVASLPPPQISATSTPTSTTATTTTATSTAFGATGIYYYAPSPPNITYAQAQSIVSSLGVVIASPAQLTQGGMQGINFCNYGWLNNGKAGLYMQTANPNCGPQGLSYNNSNIAYGIWVYGVVPMSVFASGSPSFAVM